jgi:hypothetical protein
MTTLTSPSPEQLRNQVDQILHSPAFATSETLRKLLAFLSAHALAGKPDSLKVREIAVEVFGRSPDFDSQSDSVVRVHTGRLRSKLAEYYMDQGADDEVIISIPKGGYALTCHFRHASSAALSHADIAAEQAGSRIHEVTNKDAATARAFEHTPVSIRLLLIGLIAALLAGWTASSFFSQRAERAKVPAVLRTFWQDFVNPAETSLIVFSNFRLLRSDDLGLVTYTGPDDPTKPIIETYTTMGEVMGVNEVSRILLQMGKVAEPKRSRLLTWDAAKDSNLIFIGGPLAETPLRDVAVLREFQFKLGALPTQRTGGAIYNSHPRPGEAPVYFASSSVYSHSDVHTSKVDYAVIALRPSFNPSHRNLVLAGISEYGTQGAADFATNENCLRTLFQKLGVKSGMRLPCFEALIRVTVEGGVPVESDLVLVHPAI